MDSASGVAGIAGGFPYRRRGGDSASPSLAETCCLGLPSTLRFTPLDVLGKGPGMETAKITSKGQITIPKQVRVRLSVEPGDQLAFEFDERGLLRVTPVRKLLPPLRGFLAKDAAGRRLDCEQIDEAIRRRMRMNWTKSCGGWGGDDCAPSKELQEGDALGRQEAQAT